MNLTNILPMLAPLLAGPPLTALLYKNLGTLSPPTKWLLLAFCVGILIAGTTFLAHYWPHVGRSVKYLTSGAALVTMTLSWQSGNLFPGPSDVTIRYSDGSVSPSQPPNTVTVWGRQHRAWTLHPPYGSDRMADQLEARFLDRPSRVKVWVSKPPPTLLMPDGTPTNSDGISLELAAINHWGHVAKRKTVNISQRNFLERRWISKNLSFDSGISRIAIRVTAGPPGSTPYNDATLVALQSHSTSAYLSAVGDLFLRGLAVAVVLLGLPALLFRKAGGCSLRQAASFVSTARAALPVFLLVLVVGAIAYCHAIQSDVIYYWDLRNYWAQTEHLYEVLKESGWRDALLLIASTYSAEYSMLPALLPALLSLVIGYPTHLSFSVMMAVIYAAPAFLMTSYLGWRCFTTAAVDRHPGSAKLSLAALAPLLAIPAFLAGALVNRPDIGGVILAGAASILAVRLTVLIAGHGMPANIWPPHPRLVGTSLALATLLSTMFLFRRWYMFTAVGIVLTVTLFVAYDVWRAQQGRLGVLVRAAMSACLVAMGILSLVAWVMFDWARDLDAHDYLDLYSAYRLSLLTTLKLMVQALGVLVPAIALGAVWVRLRHAGDRRLLVLLCGTTAVSALLFLQISSPGLHHYYLLMPLLGAGTVGAALMLVRWNKRRDYSGARSRLRPTEAWAGCPGRS